MEFLEKVVGKDNPRPWVCLRRALQVFSLIGFLLVLGNTQEGWASQLHTPTPGGGEGQSVSLEGHDQLAFLPAAVAMAQEGRHGPESTPPAAPKGGAHAPAAPGSQQPAQKGQGAPQAPKGAPHETAAPGPAPVPEPGAKPEVHAEHGPVLPVLSPTPGVTFVETMIKLMEYELHGRTLGWRPNDLLIGRFTDDVNNYQLGVLEAIRFTTLRLKDSLTRMGDADTYDPDLEQALNLFMNNATRFWLPSAEGSYSEALDHMNKFLEKLKAGRRNFYYRKDNLTLLLASYRDLLGNVNRSLIASDVSWFQTDNSFYYAKGIAHVYYEILRVVRVGYQSQLASTLNATEILNEILHELYRVEQMDPWIVLDGKLDGFLANHRANLNAPLSEVNHLLVVLSQL
jgi:hypothetical protein